MLCSSARAAFPRGFKDMAAADRHIYEALLALLARASEMDENGALLERPAHYSLRARHGIASHRVQSGDLI